MNWYVYISLTFPVCLSLSVPHDSLSLYSTLTLCPFIVSVFLLLSPTPFVSLFPSLCVVLFVSPLFFSLPNIYNTILPLCYPTPHCSPALLLPSSFSPLFISFSHVILTLPIPTSFHPTSFHTALSPSFPTSVPNQPFITLFLSFSPELNSGHICKYYILDT